MRSALLRYTLCARALLTAASPLAPAVAQRAATTPPPPAVGDPRIRDVLYQIEKQRFLMTVHPVFQNAPIVAETDALPEMYQTRETLAGALDSMRQALAELEAVSGPTPPRPPQPQR